MGLDAVVIGSLAAVVISVIVVGVVVYNIVKNMGENNSEK
jgi:hypothetical protein